MQGIRLLVTLVGMVAPNIAIMVAMGWMSTVHFAVLGAWMLVSTALILLIPERHRRLELHKRSAIITLCGFVALAALVLGTAWDVRLIIGAVLVLPGLIYLLLEGIGVTPKPRQPDSPLP
jgi:hypothetical protein